MTDNKTHLNEEGQLSFSAPEKQPLVTISTTAPKGYKPPKKDFPFMITKRCDMACKFCIWRNYPEWNSKDLDVTPEFFEEAIIKMKNAKFPFSQVALVGGEVCMHPQFKQLCDILVKHKFKFTLVTNGKQWEKYKFLLEEPYNKYFDAMAFSLDGKPETHDKYRGQGSYNKTIEAINYFLNKKPFSIKMVLRSDNYMDLPHTFSVFDKLFRQVKNKKNRIRFEGFSCKVSEDFVLKQPHIEEVFKNVKVIEKKYKNFYNKSGRRDISFNIFFCEKGNKINFCPALDDQSFLIFPDGSTSICCGGFPPTNTFGNIKTSSVEELLEQKCNVSLFLVNKIFPYLHRNDFICMKDPCALCRHFVGETK
jgi:MoaA/NifB/PqqE/SkfB family radical SAM enzyme